MKRSRWKLPFILPKFLNINKFKSKIALITNKSMCIVPSFINFKFIVYSGNVKKSVHVRKPMIGSKIGEFVLTKIFGSEISNSMALKERRKKEDKKKKK